MIWLWSVLVAVVLVETLALSFRLNYWRRRADAIEHAAFTYSEAKDDLQVQHIVLSAAWHLLGLMIYLVALLAMMVFALNEFPNMVNVRDDVFILTASAAFIVYAWLRANWLERRQGNRPQVPLHTAVALVLASEGYNRIARWLHWMALEVGLVRRTSFELEKAFFLAKAQRSPLISDRPVYVMGLARSGTTILLEILAKTSAFHSPTYRDMPFVLCPNLWKWVNQYSRMDAKLVSRAHDDGMTVGFDSPESFEEVFWRTACELASGPAMGYASIDAETLADFEAYRQLSVYSALAPEQSQALRYLSKNNNNLLRLQELSAQVGSKLVLVIRDPLATALSLYRQHLRFTQIQADDAFVRAYMRWLGHHEFGLGQKPLSIGTHHLQGLHPCQPDYWLAYWLGVYETLWQSCSKLSTDCQARIFWVSYEHLCMHPEQELARLFAFADIQHSAESYCAMLKLAAPSAKLASSSFNSQLTLSAHKLHHQIVHSQHHEIS